MTTKFQNTFTWSKSRDLTFQECPRRYFYHYYGSWGGWDRHADARTRLLYVLKHLQTRHMWAGGKVHDAVQQLLQSVQAGLPVPGGDALADRTLRRMRAEFRESQDLLHHDDPKGRCGLYEHEYDVAVDDRAWKDLADHVGACIRTFHGSATFGRIRGVPIDQWLEIEQLASFDAGGTKVYVVLDFAHRDEDRVVIYDWKTGRAQPDENALQFACYALYAERTWGATPDDIRAYEYNLSRDEVHEHRIERDTVAAAHDYILESVGEMQGLLDDIEHNRASEDAFPMTDDEQACRTCNYRKVCPQFT